MKTTEENVVKIMQKYLKDEVVGKLRTSPLRNRFLNTLKLKEKYAELFEQYQLLLLTAQSKTTKVATLVTWIQDEIAVLNKAEKLGVMYDVATTMMEQEKLNKFSEDEKKEFETIIADEEKKANQGFFLKTLSGKTGCLWGFSPKDAVAKVREAICELEGIPEENKGQIRLIANGRQLEDSKNLETYGVEDRDTIHIVARTLGN